MLAKVAPIQLFLGAVAVAVAVIAAFLIIPRIPPGLSPTPTLAPILIPTATPFVIVPSPTPPPPLPTLTPMPPLPPSLTPPPGPPPGAAPPQAMLATPQYVQNYEQQWQNNDAGHSSLRVVVETGNIEDIAHVLRGYTWMTGELDLTSAAGLYLYDEAWVSATYQQDYTYDLNIPRPLQHYGLVATVFMNSTAADGFCGVRTNANQDSYIDVLLYRDGTLRSWVVVDGMIVDQKYRRVFDSSRSVITDGSRAFATIWVVYDEPGLTVIADYHILGSAVSSSERIHIDYGHLLRGPGAGNLQLRAGTTRGQTTFCAFNQFFQYPIRHPF